MGDTLNYKLWAIRVEISRLKKLIKHFPKSDQLEDRRQRLINLQKDLSEIES